MVSSIALNIPILVLSFLFITSSFVAPAPETWTINIYDTISFANRVTLICDLNSFQYPPRNLAQGTNESFTVDVDLPKPGGNYVLTCNVQYATSPFACNFGSHVLFDYQKDKSRCRNKVCNWEVNEDGVVLFVAPAPETWTIKIYDSISVVNRLTLICDLNGFQLPRRDLAQGTDESFTVDVDLPIPGGNYVLTCIVQYAYLTGARNFGSRVLFDYQKDKSRCKNKVCEWVVYDDGVVTCC